MPLLEKLFSKRPGRATLAEAARNFSRMQEACVALQNPQHTFPSVHIAGTNGKGSVAVKIARTLEYAGYKVGLFTSPHIERFSERIQINGVEIAVDEIEKRAEVLMERFPDLHFFNYATLLAFQWFAEESVDLAVIEAGIGGRFDATNCLKPLVSVITSISLDHVELLGGTVEEIASQKAGIIRSGVPVVLGPRVQHIEAPNLIQATPQSEDYDLENQATASAALTVLQNHFNLRQFQLTATLPCRFEKIGRFVLDVAHNPAGITHLLKRLDLHYPGRPINVIVGLSAEKDLKGCLLPLARRAAHLFLVEAVSPRAAPLSTLKEILDSHFTCCASIQEAVHLSLARKPVVLVCGSFYIMQEARTQILRLQVGCDEPFLGGSESSHEHPDSAPVLLR